MTQSDVNVAYTQHSPDQSNEERLTTEALAESQAPEDVVRMLTPPLPQIVAFPPRFGWPTYEQRQPGIEEVFDLDRMYGDFSADRSGSYTGSARNVTSDSRW